jgi:hypothetical protein
MVTIPRRVPPHPLRAVTGSVESQRADIVRRPEGTLDPSIVTKAREALVCGLALTRRTRPRQSGGEEDMSAILTSARGCDIGRRSP